MKARLLLFLFLPFALPLTSAAPSEEPLRETHLRDDFIVREEMVPMRDGVKLFTLILTPKTTSGRLPILLDLLTVVYLSVPGSAAFTEGEFAYHLRGDKLVFNEIYLRGPTLSLVGSGSMSMETKELKLYFPIDPLGELPRLSGLADELLTGILRQLSEVEVTGTLARPKTRTRTLGSLEDAIRKLMAPNPRP